MATWDEVRNGIFAGESGGDYDAIFGYENRNPNSRFGNVRPSQMTVGQAVDFTQPNGAYGQHVKGQIGRVATPIGAYQVVGTTLRAAVDALGLDPSQPFDRATQDRIGEWIYKTQGTGAWEGYRGPQSGGGEGYTRSTKGGSDMGSDDASNWDRIMAAAPQATARSPLANALMAFAQNAPSMYKGQGMDFAPFAGGGKRTNQTLQWLVSAGRKDLAAAVVSGVMTPEDAAKQVYADRKDGAANDATQATVQATAHKDQLAAAATLRDDMGKEFGELKLVQDGAGVIKTLYDNPGAISDYALAVAFAKIVDPGSVAREGEVAAVNSAGSFIPAWAEYMKNVVNGTGKMPEAMRQEIAQTGARLANSRIQTAQPKLDHWKKQAEDMGVPWDWVWSGDVQPFDVPTGSGGGKGGAGAAAAPAPSGVTVTEVPGP